MLTNLFFVVFGYLAGSISTAILVCRALGLPDPRQEGSRNPGATNVLRFGGKKAADMEKMWKSGRELYKGYVDDPRNTDNAWMETVVVNFHDEDGVMANVNLEVSTKKN